LNLWEGGGGERGQPPEICGEYGNSSSFIFNDCKSIKLIYKKESDK